MADRKRSKAAAVVTFTNTALAHKTGEVDPNDPFTSASMTRMPRAQSPQAQSPQAQSPQAQSARARSGGSASRASRRQSAASSPRTGISRALGRGKGPKGALVQEPETFSRPMTAMEPMAVELPRLSSRRTNTPIFFTLVWLELRKLVDTAAARVLLGLAFVLCLAVAGALTWGHTSDRAGNAIFMSNVLTTIGELAWLPLSVIGMMVMIGDWSSHNAAAVFSRVKGRTTLYLAKLVAAMLVCLVAMAAVFVGVLTVAYAVSASTHRELVLDLEVEILVLAALVAVAGALLGCGLAAVTRRLPVAVAIVLVAAAVAEFGYGVLPDSLYVIASPTSFLGPIMNRLAPGEVADLGAPDWQILTSFLLWYVGPLIGGWWVADRADV